MLPEAAKTAKSESAPSTLVNRLHFKGFSPGTGTDWYSAHALHPSLSVCGLTANLEMDLSVVRRLETSNPCILSSSRKLLDAMP